MNLFGPTFLSEQEKRCLDKAVYGKFVLPKAVRPVPPSAVVPKSGFDLRFYHNCPHGKIPTAMISASKEKLFGLFLDMIDVAGAQTVDAVVSTSHKSVGGRHRDLRRNGIDRVVFESICVDFEDILVDDGCTGIAAVGRRETSRNFEVLLDSHKILFFYNWPMARNKLKRLFKRYGLARRRNMKFVSDDLHVHNTTPLWREKFGQMALRLGAIPQ